MTTLSDQPALLSHLPDGGDRAARKANHQRFYDALSAQLDASPFGRFSFFLNYGYVADGSPERAAVSLPTELFNRNSIKLVLEVIGDCRVDGSSLLDVGCGRGGTIHTLHSFFRPGTLTGVDLSARAIEFSTRRHSKTGASFSIGDAEQLLFADASFDVVTNIESSHSYPDVNRFYAEAHRVLRPNGFFLYADVLSAPQFAAAADYLVGCGFVLECNRNITTNVLLSCQDVAAARTAAFDARNESGFMSDFLAMPGSKTYEQMSLGQWQYRIMRLRKV